MPAKKPPAKPPVKMPSIAMPDYGMDWGEQQPKTALIQELWCFALKNGSQKFGKLPDGRIVSVGKGRGRSYHFRRIVDMLWNYPGAPKPFLWHPDAERMLKAACQYKRLGVAGAGSTGKSDFFAVWALVTWMANAHRAMVLVTSTTKGAAANRIWGKIVSYWNALPAAPAGKLIGSDYAIYYFDHHTGQMDKTAGIKLVAGEASKAAKSADEMRGIKGNPLVVIGDEFAELSHSLTNTFNENLTANYNHQIIALANPDTYFDPFGEFCEPVSGWDSVGEDDYEWEAKNGAHVIRLNAELSPNIIEGKTIYPFLMQQDQLEEKLKVFGSRTHPGYYRGVLGMWCPTGNELTIYTQAELMCSKVCQKAVWRGEAVRVAGFDVAFTHDGDRSVLCIGSVGVTVEGRLTLAFEKYIEINEDTKIKDVDRTTQIVRKLKAACLEHNVLPENLAIDASGPGGKAFRDAVIAQWSSKFLAVDFSGAASDKPVSKLDRTPCNKRYDRRVSEIWFGAKSFIRSDQLRGITNALAAEMVVRRYRETKPSSPDNKIIVETKKEMKIRTQKSPDIADSWFALVELCRTRHRFVSLEAPADRAGGNRGPDPVRKRFKELQAAFAA